MVSGEDEDGFEEGVGGKQEEKDSVVNSEQRRWFVHSLLRTKSRSYSRFLPLNLNSVR